MKRHIAFLNIPAAGHVTPTLGVVEELVKRGHKVSYLAAGPVAERIASTGAEIIPYTSALDPRTIAPTGAQDWLARVLLGAVREAAATAPVLEAHFGDDLPDCLVYDISMQFLGRVMSRKLGIPGIQLYPVLASHQYFSQAHDTAEGLFGDLTRELRTFADTHGLHDTPLDELMSDAPATSPSCPASSRPTPAPSPTTSTPSSGSPARKRPPGHLAAHEQQPRRPDLPGHHLQHPTRILRDVRESIRRTPLARRDRRGPRRRPRSRR